jgi:hypothetical protein
LAPSETIPANRCPCAGSDGLACKRDRNVIPVCQDPVVATVWMGREISAGNGRGGVHLDQQVVSDAAT